MKNPRLIVYMVIVNILPLLLFDRLSYLLDTQYQTHPLYVFDNRIASFILFVGIYLITQKLLFNLVLTKLYTIPQESQYVSN